MYQVKLIAGTVAMAGFLFGAIYCAYNHHLVLAVALVVSAGLAVRTVGRIQEQEPKEDDRQE